MNLEKSIQNYLDELSSNSPTPGGGNVAALCGVLASSLGVMVCNLTIGKKKYLDFEPEAIRIKESLTSFKNDFLKFAKRDNEAFDRVMEAFKLSKDNEAQINFRNEKIQNASWEAAIVPAEVIRKCNEVLPLIKIISERGNQNSLSDAGVAASLISASAEGAYLNVLINCSSLSNQVTAGEFLKTNEIIFNEVKEKSATIISSIIKKITKRNL
ncbi:MAG TPA: cyclodeaminase/cyclohydrolase family protein [Ignavibacteriaceae bacterium]|nr:cyclodeaminase/cyclohydrolase family protein [Ignavibacteriaceae bacterium]